MRILLITPQRESRFLKKTERFFFLPRLTMPVIAALTPPDVKVRLVDEYVEKINYKEHVDLVGITTWTSTAHRAYKIADRFRERGVPVILGGLHASALPEEALEHADAVVIGEVEGVWLRLIDDFRNHRLQRIYDGTIQRPDITKIPIPRRKLIKSNSLIKTQSVQATRGCPFACEFCSVTNFFGNTYRFRNVDEVIKDVKSTNSKLIYFVDDNIIGNRKYAEQLFTKLIPLKKKWVGQSTLTIANNESLLKLAAKSGCIGLLVGLESLSGTNLKKLGLIEDREKFYKKQINKIHEYNIAVDASIVFGFDEDEPKIFERTLKFCVQAKVDLASFHLLTPYPGTPLYNRLDKENRLLHKDWSKYDENTVVFHPAKMSVKCLQNGFNWTWKEFYSISSVIKRLRYNLWFKSIFYLAANLPYHLDTRRFQVYHPLRYHA